MTYTQDWFDHNIKHLTDLLAHRSIAEQHMIEVGSFEGRSSVWFLKNVLTHPKSTLCCIDTWQGSPEHDGIDFDQVWLNFLENTKDYRSKMFVIKGFSAQALLDLRWDRENRESRNRIYDIIYIDGSHKAADVFEDARQSFMLLRVGGIMIFDDYLWTQGETEADRPKQGIDEFMAKYGYKLKVVYSGYQFAVEKIAV